MCKVCPHRVECRAESNSTTDLKTRLTMKAREDEYQDALRETYTKD